MNSNQTASTPKIGRNSVVLIGLGNIGSPLVDLLARMGTVDQLTLVDRDIYEERNVGGQAILPEDVGHPKVEVQAERVRRINPSMTVIPIHASVEYVPLGQFRSDVIVACLDSKLARQWVNQIAWRLITPWIDGGVAFDGLLVRVNVYSPGNDQPCLECSWGKRDYQNLEERRPCQAEESNTHTNAPAYLGSLAGALQAIECDKILSGNMKTAAIGKQVTLAAETHQLHTMTFQRNPNCRFDHQSFRIRPFPCEPTRLSVRELFGELEAETGHANDHQLYVDGHSFEREWRCGCGETKAVLRLAGRTASVERTCAACGGTMEPVGFSAIPFLSDSQLAPNDLEKSLASLGLRSGDVLLLRSDSIQHGIELLAS